MLHATAIIGAGPAGMIAAIQLKRNGYNPLLIEKKQVGGLLLNANLVENYPGFAQGLPGKSLVRHFTQHLTKIDITPIKAEVTNVQKHKKGFRIITNLKQYDVKAVIVASGTKPRPFGFDKENELYKSGRLFYEVNNFPQLKPNDIVTIIGGGDAAFDYALNLANHLKKIAINILYRSAHPHCLPLLWDRVKKQKSIRLFAQTIATNVSYQDNNRNYLILKIKKVKTIAVLKTKYVLVAVGRDPQKEFLDHKINWDNVPGFFMAGDVKRGRFRQAVIAAGDGLLAAMHTVDFLNSLKK